MYDEFIRNASKTVKKRSEIKEIDIEEAYCDHAKVRGCVALKLVILRKKAFPDRTTICSGGRILFIEFKRIGKKPTALQIKMKGLLMSFGFEYHVCDKIGQAEKILDKFLQK